MEIEAVLDFINAKIDRIIEETIEISQISAPTFQEEKRANHIQQKLEEFGATKIRKDEVGNVIASYRVDPTASTVMIAAHLDTVFNEEVDLQVTREDPIVAAPGICDNSLGLEGLLVVAKVLNKFNIELGYNLILAATVGEEGLGNLKGMTQLMEDYEEKVDEVIALEGDGLGRVTNQAIGSSRWRVKFKATGGHSWSDFGQPSAIHTMSKAIAALNDFKLPNNKKTTYNVGKVSGGRTINTIAQEAEMLWEVRSLESNYLEQVVKEFKDIIKGIANKDKVKTEFELIGERPAGRISSEHELIKIISQTHKELGIESKYEAASTDGNLPLNLGIPAVTIGLTRGDNIHREDEYMEIEPVKLGLKQLLLIIDKLNNRGEINEED
ncbi:M20/M25/M40 family metallo-hydrolase [Selenihalanaerobacter shriftii]|uniref:Acetylornithine deacetylase/Succinyl-diaminopimelate desuccinylase n=1 Tax=Selenihalanaerobacter shriftii TaxID=142842 RepID=A0A1T4MPE3_9FIRM|nr:M20/M25/M40 family metallo-hydrolase [Selenihalanaerobacter shriftii]SJZ68654.1 Acetylornithine deacetylase/Succinyl-diaminopimelate desuccinylase [Selenihalanaerobacter shriftii]